MKKIFKRVLLLVCATALILSFAACSTLNGRVATGSAAATGGVQKSTPAPTAADEGTASDAPTAEPTATPEPTPFHSDLHFSDIVYTSPDVDGLIAGIEQLTSDIESGKEDLETLFDRYDELETQYENVSSADSHAFLLYAFDVTDEAMNDEYTRLDAALTEIYTLLTGAGVALFDSSEEAERMAIDRYGEDYVRVTRQDNKLYNDRIAELLSEDLELQSEYDTLCATFTIRYQGRDMTLDDILSDDTLSYSEYYSLYETYSREFNYAAGQVFLDMIALRNEIAVEAGYGNYAAYRYDCYERDFSVTEAKAFHAAVKEYIVPVFIELSNNESIYDLYGATYSESSFFDTFKNVAGEFDPRMSEALTYMLDHGLYDTSVSDTKIELSFTTHLSEYGMPYIFMQWDDSYTCIGTMLHEFGHFMSYYADTGNYSLDMAEIDSQALELLMMPYFEEFYGTRYASAAKQYLLSNAIDSIVMGSMEDEFQQIVYENPDMTLNEINSVYSRLVDEYGMAVVLGYSAETWAMIPHTFSSPMYYISYAVSVIPALEMWQTSQKDYQSAVDTYFSVMDRPIYAQLRAVMAENGLSDPVAPSTVQQIADLLRNNLS